MTVDSDIAELTASIKQSLDASGGLAAIRAQLRAQVFGAMQISAPQLEQKPTLNPAAKLALGLIDEFLRFNNCNCTLSTAESEVAGQISCRGAQLPLFFIQTDVHRRSFSTRRSTLPEGRRGISSTTTTRLGRL